MHHLTESDVGQTLAAFLRSRMEGTAWSRIQKLVRSRHVLVHGNVCTDAARRLKAGEVVKVLEVAAAPLPKADDVAVVHVDDDVVVVEKPTGVNTTRHHEEASWPARRRQVQPTLEELVPDAIGRHLFKRFGGVAGRGEPKRRRIQPVRAVHRIDRETSGLVVFTRNVPASRILAEQFRLHTTHRRYLAIVVGRVTARTIRSQLIRDRGDGRRGSAEGEEGKEAVTHVAPLEQFGDDYTLVECRLETGRTHQIRLHLAHLGFPIVGDPLYLAGGQSRLSAELHPPHANEATSSTMLLHAWRLTFVHPLTGRSMALEASPWGDAS